jgi:F1F0 ATPase subunit 2
MMKRRKKMSELSAIIVALLVGILLGAIFFGGLWWTIRRGISASLPAVWFSSSLLLRMAIAITGFYFVSQGDWRRLAGCLLGFLLARVMVTRLTRVPRETRRPLIEEGAP